MDLIIKKTMLLLIAILTVPLVSCEKDSGLPLLGRMDIEGKTVWVQKADGSIQCESPIDKAASLDAHYRILLSAGIDVLAADCGSASASTDMACGLPTGGVNFFRIQTANQVTAEALGFEPIAMSDVSTELLNDERALAEGDRDGFRCDLHAYEAH